MSRKGENIYKRKDKRWEGRYICSYNEVGKARYKSVYGHSYTEVRLKLQKRTDSTCFCTKAPTMTLVEWIRKCLGDDEAQIKLSTYKLYERYLNNYIVPFFGGIALRKISTEMLQTFVNSLRDLSSSTIRGIFSFLREALKRANKENYITPVWIAVELPKQSKHSVEVFTRDEQSRIEQEVKHGENPNDIGVLICLYMGLRIGEVCGLKWEDIDFKTKTMEINRTVQRMTVDGKSVLTELPPKSESSRRKIPIPTCLKEILENAKASSDCAYVLSTKNHAMDPRTFQNQYKKLLDRADVRYANFHTLRHTFSVRALELGFDVKTLSEVLGHADTSITLRTYAHSLNEHKRVSMERFGQICA